MSALIAVDRQGRRWEISSIGDAMQGRCLDDGRDAVVMDVAELVDDCGPIVLSPNVSTGGHVAFLDTVDLVATDPETATVEQVAQVSSFAHSILTSGGRRI